MLPPLPNQAPAHGTGKQPGQDARSHQREPRQRPPPARVPVEIHNDQPLTSAPALTWGQKPCVWQRLPSLGPSTALAPGELMILPRAALGPLPSRAWMPWKHLERRVCGAPCKASLGSVRPTQRTQGTYPRGRRLPQCPPAGLALQSLIACLVDARQGDAVSSLLLLSPAESSIQVCGPLLGSRHRGRETGKFISLRPRQSNTPASQPVARPAWLVTRSLAASILPCFPADLRFLAPSYSPSSLLKVGTWACGGLVSGGEFGQPARRCPGSLPIRPLPTWH